MLNYPVYKNKWTISNYCSLYLCLYPHGENIKSHPSIYLKINNSNGNTVELDYSFRLVNVLDKSKPITKHMGENGEIFILSDKINKENGWVSEDKLTIEIYIKILNQTYETLES
ncbi:hypothetical protein ACTFIY_000983 [Dictyostelium cf. discoideum]